MTPEQIEEAFSRAVMAGALRKWWHAIAFPTVYGMTLNDGRKRGLGLAAAEAWAEGWYACEAAHARLGEAS